MQILVDADAFPGRRFRTIVKASPISISSRKAGLGFIAAYLIL